jgi:hypothetical protein
MTEQAPCPLGRPENPPENRFCRSCGAPLMNGEQLATRQEHHPDRAARAWPSKLGPAGKALAVGVAALATEAGLSWATTQDRDRRAVVACRPRRWLSLGRLSRRPEPGRGPRRGMGGFPRPGCRAPRGTIVRLHGADR